MSPHPSIDLAIIGGAPERFVPFADNLFCDRAVTIPTPRTQP